MDYSKTVPSRELCEEMARLGICQTEQELIWRNINGSWHIEEITVLYKFSNHFIAPTLPRMMEELPKTSQVMHSYFEDVGWFVICGEVRSEDKHLPNAVAKVLIAIKKGQ